jgi:23S rRNA 5-hydroxycytidine C2501 synthase
MARHCLELLAPARDADIGIEAINHGADAVYIGGPGFGARDKASNSVADIERLVRHAHRFHARVFVTLNTILRDDELEAARALAWQLHAAGVDALIVQDMGLLQLDLPPIQLHASTQTDIRTPEKARFLQDVGFSQMVLARELDLHQIAAIREQVQHAVLEFFVHGALCVAYSGQCFISHAMTGRSANRGNCSQECRQPFTVTDAQGRIVAHDKHVLSLKDNNQSDNLAALIDAGIRSFKIEGRYKDMATVKNVVAHYRSLCDALLDGRKDLRAASHGRCTYTFKPNPDQGYNRGATDYFVNGRQLDVGAFDSPKHVGEPLGHVVQVGTEHVDIAVQSPTLVLHNGDALTWWDAQGELQGVPLNTAVEHSPGLWRVVPSRPVATLKDLKRDRPLHRNRDMAWERLLSKPSSDRRIAVDVSLAATTDGLALSMKDEAGHVASVRTRLIPAEAAPAHDQARAQARLQTNLAKLGNTCFTARRVRVSLRDLPNVSVATVNALRRDAVVELERVRLAARPLFTRGQAVEPPAVYPDDALTYLANVYNHQAAAFYAKHGVRVVDAAYESHEALGEVSLMITKHCVRWSLSLCPKQAKGVAGVQGTVRAEPMTLQHGNDRFTLRFDCKPCEMHVVGAMRPHVLKALKAEPITVYRSKRLFQKERLQSPT